jgi:hypothetical protein
MQRSLIALALPANAGEPLYDILLVLMACGSIS